jgi:hypothetical protein
VLRLFLKRKQNYFQWLLAEVCDTVPGIEFGQVYDYGEDPGEKSFGCTDRHLAVASLTIKSEFLGRFKCEII